MTSVLDFILLKEDLFLKTKRTFPVKLYIGYKYYVKLIKETESSNFIDMFHGMKIIISKSPTIELE